MALADEGRSVALVLGTGKVERWEKEPLGWHLGACAELPAALHVATAAFAGKAGLLWVTAVDCCYLVDVGANPSQCGVLCAEALQGQTQVAPASLPEQSTWSVEETSYLPAAEGAALRLLQWEGHCAAVVFCRSNSVQANKAAPPHSGVQPRGFKHVAEIAVTLLGAVEAAGAPQVCGLWKMPSASKWSLAVWVKDAQTSRPFAGELQFYGANVAPLALVLDTTVTQLLVPPQSAPSALLRRRLVPGTEEHPDLLLVLMEHKSFVEERRWEAAVLDAGDGEARLLRRREVLSKSPKLDMVSTCGRSLCCRGRDGEGHLLDWQQGQCHALPPGILPLGFSGSTLVAKLASVGGAPEILFYDSQ